MATILVVEDDPTTGSLIKTELQQKGYTVAIAKDGIDGLEQARTLRPPVIISDWMMPNMDGLELCRHVKQDIGLSNIFFILLTAHTDIERRVEGIEAGADEFISKPFTKRELHARVSQGMREYEFKRLMRLTNEQLSQTLEQLRQTQAQLVQNAKMSSLGQMMAGLAHEMNNPVNFLEGNLIYTRKSVQDLLGLVELYQMEYPEATEAIQDYIEDIDLEFLAADLPKVLQSMETGTKRISQIVSSFRRFSRLDEDGLKASDLHEGLDESLFLLQHRFALPEVGKEILIEKNYGTLPLVDCFPGQINQVFFNVLTNAVDFLALAVSKKPDLATWQPRISITTSCVDDRWVEVAIADNGTGMLAEFQQRVFDPFFTTKPVGQGTGMGLSVSYQMVTENHFGIMTCESVFGEGTKFTISLPITNNFSMDSDQKAD